MVTALSVLWLSVEFYDRFHGSSKKQMSECHPSWERRVVNWIHVVRQARYGVRLQKKKAVEQSEKQPRADLTRLKLIGRYFLHAPRAACEFPLQDEESTVTMDGFSDTDSTSAGTSRIGRHTLSTWSATQKVTLSSAESEYYSAVRCATEATGLANTIRQLGHEAHVRIWTWETKVISGCSRKGKHEELRIARI